MAEKTKSKKLRFNSPSTVAQISESVRMGEEEAGALDLQNLPLTRIDLDPENPASMGLTVEDVLGSRHSETKDAAKQAMIDSLAGLATSITSSGVQQPIKVFRDRERDRFRVVFGERRFLASHLAGKLTVPAWVLPERPTHVRVLQFIENFQREDRTAWQRVINIRGIAAELGILGEAVTPLAIADYTGVTQRQANTYLNILGGPDDVLQALEQGVISSLEKAAVISGIKSAPQRIKAIEATAMGASVDALRSLSKSRANKGGVTADPRPAGRPVTKVHLGTTANPLVVKRIITTMAGEGAGNDVDWSDLRAVRAAWKNFLMQLESTAE